MRFLMGLLSCYGLSLVAAESHHSVADVVRICDEDRLTEEQAQGRNAWAFKCALVAENVELPTYIHAERDGSSSSGGPIESAAPCDDGWRVGCHCRLY